jgi:hypothetical protein
VVYGPGRVAVQLVSQSAKPRTKIINLCSRESRRGAGMTKALAVSILGLLPLRRDTQTSLAFCFALASLDEGRETNWGLEEMRPAASSMDSISCFTGEHCDWIGEDEYTRRIPAAEGLHVSAVLSGMMILCSEDMLFLCR